MFSAHLYLYNTGHVSRVYCFTVKHANIIVNSQIQIVTPQFGKLLEWGCYNCGHGLSLETGEDRVRSFTHHTQFSSGEIIPQDFPPYHCPGNYRKK